MIPGTRVHVFLQIFLKVLHLHVLWLSHGGCCAKGCQPELFYHTGRL
ncbi:hypothetical protein GLYMA_06G201451v4 [Glycine max]|nr:hypothetical protein GLYMA_06G201451v4 [Glycine max]KAH1126779.1 hypothetical protein GYH30_015680 [Glycine max]